MSRTVITLYVLAVAAFALVGFLSPVWYLGFIPIGLGCIWAMYDLVDVEEPRTSVEREPTSQ